MKERDGGNANLRILSNREHRERERSIEDPDKFRAGALQCALVIRDANTQFPMTPFSTCARSVVSAFGYKRPRSAAAVLWRMENDVGIDSQWWSK